MQNSHDEHILKLSQILTPKYDPANRLNSSFDHSITPWNVDSYFDLGEQQKAQLKQRKELIQKKLRQSINRTTVQRKQSISKITEIGKSLVEMNPRYGGMITLSQNTIDQQRQQFASDSRPKKSTIHLPLLPTKTLEADITRLTLKGHQCHHIGRYGQEYYPPIRLFAQESSKLSRFNSLDAKEEKLRMRKKSFHKKELILGKMYYKNKKTIERA